MRYFTLDWLKDSFAGSNPVLTTLYNKLKNMRSNCKCCGRNLDSRLGICFDCANAESIIIDGVDMYDTEIPKQEGLSTALSKVQHILKMYGVIQK